MSLELRWLFHINTLAHFLFLSTPDLNPYLRSEELGTLGEGCFRTLCDEARIIATKPATDKHGWDFYCEFPPDNFGMCDLDNLLAPIKFKVQVKSTYYKYDKNKFAVKFKVSALASFIKSPEPCFFCFIEYDPRNDKPLHVYVLHVGKSEIADTLKKIRGIQKNKGRDVSLNKEERTINYKNALKLTSLDGIKFSEAIKRYIPDGLDDYIKNKRKIFDTIGYENGTEEFNIQLDRKDYSIMFNSMLGVESKEIPLSSCSRFTKRFDILLQDDKFSSPEMKATLQIYPPYSNGEIVFKHSDLSNEITFSAKLFTWGHEKSLRIESNFFELIYQPLKGLDFKININDDKRYTIKELISLAKFMLLLCEDQSFSVGFNITSQSSRRENDSIDTLEVENRYLNIVSLSPNMKDTISNSFEFNWYDLSIYLERIATLVSYNNIPINSVFVSFSELMDENNLVEYMLSIENSCGQNIDLSSANILKLKNGQEIILIWPLMCKIGNYLFTKTLRVNGVFSHDSDLDIAVYKVIEVQVIQSKFVEERKVSELKKIIDSISDGIKISSGLFTPLLIPFNIEKEISPDDYVTDKECKATT